MTSIEKVYIENFKSHKNYSLHLDKKYKHIVVYGKNGVGKTNLLDSLSSAIFPTMRCPVLPHANK